MKEYFKKPFSIFVIIITVLVIVYILGSSSLFGSRATLPISPEFISDKSGTVSFEVSDSAPVGGALAERAPLPSATTAAGDTSDNKRIIKTAHLTIEVDNIIQSVEAVSNIALEKGGFILSSYFSENKDGTKNSNITIKVPVAFFEETLKEIKAQALFIANENIEGRDVTEEYVDLQAQLTNLRVEEEQFQNILTRAQKIEDILAITRELSRVRSNIERLQGRIKFLESQTDLATITVSLQEEGKVTVPTSKWRPFNVIKQSAVNLIKNLQDFIDNVIKFIFWVISLIPYVIIVAIIFLLVQKARKRKQTDQGN